MKLLYNWLLIIILVGLAIITAVWLQNNQGFVTIFMMGYEIETPLWVLAVIILFIISLFLTISKVISNLKFWRKKTKLKRNADNKQVALSEAASIISEFSVGNLEGAKQHLNSFAKLVGKDNALYNLLNLHFEAKQGNNLTLNNLEKYPETKFLAYGVKVNEAIEQNNNQSALYYVKQAYEMRPDDSHIFIQYFGLLLENNDFLQAENILKNAAKRKIIDKKTSNRFYAIYYFLRSKYDNTAPNGDEYLVEGMQQELLEQSFDEDVSFIPAYEWIIQCSKTNKKQAWKALKNSWKKKPSSQLTDIMLQYLADENIFRNFQKVAKYHPENLETQIALARSAMYAEQYELARNYLKAALIIAPQKRVYELLAKLEEDGFNDEKAATTWLKQVNSAQPDPVWNCSNCGSLHSEWQLKCDNCNSFVSIEFNNNNKAIKHTNNQLFYLN